MIRIEDKHDCCGCSACASVCPRHCITMSADGEGFLYPEVDVVNCIDCGLCGKVCHELHPYDKQDPVNLFAAINKDEAVRLRSSSGGIFHILSEKIISEGGVVFGARFDEDWQAVMDYADTMEGVNAFMGSKNVQARMGSAYLDAGRFLAEGRKVLFSGTPCQIAGLHHYLRKPYDNLLTVDVVCHGTPSPKVWGLYLDEVVTAGRKAIIDPRFRNNKNGWKGYGFTMDYREAGKSLSLCSHHRTNPYMRAFLQDMILRPSCHDCRAKGGRSHSDISIADFWGINVCMPEMDDDKGTGLVLVHTDKGLSALNWNKLTYREFKSEEALRFNGSYLHSAAAHPRRECFFRQLDGCDSVNSLISDCLRPTLKQQLRMLPYTCKQLISRVVGRSTVIRKNTREWIPEDISDNLTVQYICFRNKDNGWKGFKLEI